MATNILQAIEQDVKAVDSAFRNDDFADMNIFSNRIMSNAILSEDSRLTLIGFFLKEMTMIYGAIKARKDLTTFATAKSLGEMYIRSINLKSDISQFWEQYYIFRNKIRQHQLDEYEKESYRENVEFTRFAFRWLIQKLREDRDVFLKVHNQFIRGVLNEMDRIFRVHGGELVDLYALSLVGALKLYYAYAGNFAKDKRKEFINKSVLPYVDDIVKTLLNDTVDPEEITLLLRRIIVDWRVAYIHFTEPPQLVRIQREQGVPITEETKKKISESVTKALEEKVK